MAEFEKVESFGTFGTIRGDSLEVAMVKVDGKQPRLHIGRWTQDGQHKRFTGFITRGQAEDLSGILLGMNLSK